MSGFFQKAIKAAELASKFLDEQDNKAKDSPKSGTSNSDFLSMGLEILTKSLENPDQEKIDRIKKRISAVPEGKDLMDYIESKNTKIIIKDTNENWGGEYDARYDYTNIGKNNQPNIIANTIYLNKKVSEDRLVGILLHEAWHLKQFNNGFAEMPVNGSAENFCYFYSMLEADAQSNALEICYKMRMLGDNKAWSEFSDPNKFIYEKTVEINKKTGHDAIKSGAAKQSFISFWFANTEYKEVYDTMSINKKERMERRINAYDNYNPPKALLDPSYMKGLGKLSKVDYLKGLNLSADSFHEVTDKIKALISQKFGDTQQFKGAKPSARNKPTF